MLSSVENTADNIVVLALEREGNVPSVGRMVDSIRKKIVENILDLEPVGIDEIIAVSVKIGCDGMFLYKI